MPGIDDFKKRGDDPKISWGIKSSIRWSKHFVRLKEALIFKAVQTIFNGSFLYIQLMS